MKATDIKWKVSSQVIGGDKVYQVFHLIDENKTNHSGNRECISGLYYDKEKAQKIADMFNEKTEFVANELTALICKMDKDISRAEYEIINSGEEYVHILYAPTGGQATVCVTADSLLGITKDVLKEVE